MKTFEVTSGVIVASDPCYEIPTWCQGVVENVKKGTWLSEVDEIDTRFGGKRIASLTVVNKEALDKNPLLGFDIQNMFAREPLNFEGGVDSGQFGFFDKEFYRNDESAKDLEKEDFGENYDEAIGDTWYRACCKLTLGAESWGALPNGVVSSSGYGDGSYSVFGIKDDNEEYVAFSVLFIPDELDEDEFLMSEDEDDF
jgi:hypothetical protein